MRYIAVILLIVFSFVKGFSQVQTLGFVLPEGKRKLVIPFETCQNLVIVPVVVNGQLPLRFILDTGVRTAILSERTYADMLGLGYTRQYRITGPGGEKIIGALVTNNITLTLPSPGHPEGLRGQGHSMLVLEEDYLQLSRHLGIEVHGIIGYEIFSRFVVRINYDRQELTILDPQHYRIPKRYHGIPMVIEDTKPYIRTQCTYGNGHQTDLKLMVDTGASHSLLLLPESDSSVEVPARTIQGSIGRGLGGDIQGRIGRVASIQIGSQTRKNLLINRPIASFPDPNSYSDTLRSTDVFRHGTLGEEILRRFHLIFDYSKGMLYVKKNSEFRSPIDYNLSGFNLSSTGVRLNVFEVTEVRNGSAGHEAGIHKGDLLVAVNGAPASGMSLQEINSVLNARAGRKIELEFLHEGVRVRRRLVLRDEL